jgi:Bax protein
MVGGLVALAVMVPANQLILAVSPSAGPSSPSAEFQLPPPPSGESVVARILDSLFHPERDPAEAKVETTEVLGDAFAQTGYDLDQVLTGEDVPRIFLASLPSDLGDVREIKLKKTLFFQTVLPLVLRVNEEISEARRRLWNIRTTKRMGMALSPEDRLWISAQSERYDVDEDDVDGLLQRVDLIPPSLALAQAAEESGWGSSRFVREGNAIFGQYTLADDLGLVPLGRADGMNHRVRTFDTLIECVRAYAHNLNTHKAYRAFRDMRAKYRQQGQQLDGLTLIRTIAGYSQRGDDYIKTLRVIIQTNDLGRLDGARLSDQARSRPPI